jgi:hypothetical protein
MKTKKKMKRLVVTDKESEVRDDFRNFRSRLAGIENQFEETNTTSDGKDISARISKIES